MQSDASVPASLSTARAAIADCILGDEPLQLRIGDITLHPHQRSAVARLTRTLTDHGGALLCDDVGLGKTYVALALAATYDSVAVVAPATLAAMWQHALSATHISAEFISIESLGRSGAVERKRKLIIVDEAHHFRNPCTRRYSTLAHMCMLAPVLLLTATPLHNSRDDISAIVALFKGSRAYSMTDADLALTIVRRDSTGSIGAHDVPIVEHMPPRVLISNETVLDMILALPAPVPPSDGSVATRLVIHGLVRQWASSNAALVGALKRRIARSHGLLASLEAGRYPTAAELSAWVYTGDAVQLAFAELLLPAAIPLVALASALREHTSALTELLSCARKLDDDALADFVREVRTTHTKEKIIAFSCFAETAEGLYRSLRRDGHIALLTARGAMIASGPISRAEVLEQFAPAGMGTRVVTDHEDMTVLIATDLLSEGVNLQQASILIHLDLPWTAARLEQRIGRLARMGSPHARVASYSVNPPPRAEAFLRELEIVTRKSALSEQIFGGSTTTNFSERSAEPAAIMRGERVRELMEGWRRGTTPVNCGVGRPLIASTRASCTRAIGAWIVDGIPRLLAWDESTGITTDATSIQSAIELANVTSDHGPAAPNTTQLLAIILRAAGVWYDQHCAWLAVGGSTGFPLASGARDARRTLARVADATSANVGFARRSESAALSTRLRNAATTPLPLAVEWSLESLSEYADDASVTTILDLVDRVRPAADRVTEKGIRCVALILFVPEPDAQP